MADPTSGKSRAARPTPTEAGPEIETHDREGTIQSHRERRQGEPAAAPMETDAESGGASAMGKTPPGRAPDDPAAPYMDEDGGLKDRARHEVRAGPGDAGAQDAPEVLPKTPKTPKSGAARIVLWFIVPLAILFAIYTAIVL
ncbi:hypothetical protein DC366_10315 [Pelagivirga sediminicola]|uniref:Uncharacterized protein n=1 Tax=Pelagivirga sediminicola TaxID=2170575 RepID=A0A2T7G6L1_9RHOB|nr:hypothetical protein [Pelagivirga sediminicola]PVA10043.1 hypothetical protein DC366_10315 [Pelagivirga sediminicola]